ncbi:glycoside hydrolase family 127 protein [Phycicoccus avicenniae]|nr:beta-L-arabinofuranosidase domain-containing protein [Phycicoccus avicenniae]
MTTTQPTRHHAGFVPVAPRSGTLRPLGGDQVRITDGFWARRQEVNGTRTLAHVRHWLEREGWLPNFDLAVAGGLAEGRRGREFSDSEVYKYLEALAWEIGRTGGDAHERELREVVARVAAAQEPDGYLGTAFGRPGQAPRWSDLEWGHELYCLGHLFQSAVARERTRPGADDGLLTIARRAADLVCEVFGADGIARVCGHAEVEVGLAELARVTDEPRYLEQAALFVERRGRGSLGQIEFGQQYFQDDVPVRDAEVLRGHAVRANYLAAGAVDVATDLGDDGLLEALTRQWGSTTARRTYVTGGQGSHHMDEAFGDDFVLPPDRAYSETCAGIASVMFSWRLLLAHGEARYADLIERTLYNVVATSPSSDGDAFYYANTLHQRVPGAPADPESASPRALSSLRAPWFDVSCCPPNVARTLAGLDALVATADGDGIQIHQYAGCTVDTTLDDGRRVSVRVETAYPADGRVRIVPLEDGDDAWTLSIRVPEWAAGAELAVTSGGDTSLLPAEPGYVAVRRRFRRGDAVELVLPMRPRVTRPDPRIDAVRGCVAVERGPEVLCLESVDLVEATGGPVDVAQALVDPASLDDTSGEVRIGVRTRAFEDRSWPYAGDGVPTRPGSTGDVRLVPYHSWAERGPSTMRVWMPVVDGA